MRKIGDCKKTEHTENTKERMNYTFVRQSLPWSKHDNSWCHRIPTILLPQTNDPGGSFDK